MILEEASQAVAAFNSLTAFFGLSQHLEKAGALAEIPTRAKAWSPQMQRR
jgi:hypothetical protein